MKKLSTGKFNEFNTGLYELLVALPAQMQPHVDSQEDLTFLWDIHEKLHYYEKQNPMPILQGVAGLADDLAEELWLRRNPVLPPMPDDTDDEEDSVKIICPAKNREPLRATIKKDEQTGAIIVARIMRGGAADRSGLIHIGDEFREVNGIPSQDAITFKIIYSIKEERPLKEGKMFIKALFDNDPNEDKAIPCKEAGLSFKKGDILQIMSQDDATWWQGKREGDANPRAGLNPSKHFQERRLALRRPEILVQPLTSMYEFKKSDQYDAADVPPYEETWLVLVGPVGVGLNEVKQKLLISDTQQYDVTFIEYGEYKNSYYSTSIDSVRSVLAKNKHLRILEFKLYVISIKPLSIGRLRETRKNAKIISGRDNQGAVKPFMEDNFQEMIKSAQIMETTELIVNDDLAVGFNELKTTFEKLETDTHWVPVSWLH
ncbi:hypothetical protein JEQ12_020630 [Ovis aries]|uniref:MAGUK p55 subfamily member 7 n=1 Tax=Ovis aries TaxID=9940 RepID=A0A835ZMZ2_SHEEP|nr:hypothetical protein JEQ12_020630 [Ovis aries]